MDSQSFLIFSLHGLTYGVSTEKVREIIYLPELTTAIEAPPDIVGILNLRGQILPVMDLNLRLGRPTDNYSVEDSIIILKWEDGFGGIIVNQVHDVQEIDEGLIETDLSYGREQVSRSPLVAGIARLEGQIITLLHTQNLIHATQFSQTESVGSADSLSSRINFWESASPQDQVTFQQRAQALRQRSEEQNFAGSMPLAVVGMNGEYFGLDLSVVREFTDISRVTPVPCCPSHIVGNMNLRGEIVTLVDLSPVLQANAPTNRKGKAIVAQVEDVIAGVTVDEVLDVVYVKTSEVKPLPTTVQAEGRDYLRGTAAYGDRMMTILDLSKVLTQSELTVDQQV
ncbi:MAG: chemotaxis protein CheW [Leptolyngbyaceae cyanobacterium bins.59]|nr:chemotaxis protein CheW [Leptolyngbyaceae cyanobacterium bins.59]